MRSKTGLSGYVCDEAKQSTQLKRTAESASIVSGFLIQKEPPFWRSFDKYDIVHQLPIRWKRPTGQNLSQPASRISDVGDDSWHPRIPEKPKKSWPLPCSTVIMHSCHTIPAMRFTDHAKSQSRICTQINGTLGKLMAVYNPACLSESGYVNSLTFTR